MSQPNGNGTVTASTSTSTSSNNFNSSFQAQSGSQSASQPPIRTSRALRAIRAFDSKVFPTKPSFSSSLPPTKRRKVADVQAEIDAETLASKNGNATNTFLHPPGSLFNKLTGLSAKRKREESEKIREDERKKIVGQLKGKTREELDSSTSSTLSSSKAASSYTPFSLPSLQARIATFSLSTYSSKPSTLSPLAAALVGWSNTSKECLTCSVCEEKWKVENWAEGQTTSQDGANGLKAAEAKLKDGHKDWCPWKIRGCSSTLYRLPLLSTPATLSSLASNATLLAPHVLLLVIRSPLSMEEVEALTTSVNATAQQSFSTASETTLTWHSIVLSLFGWELIVQREVVRPSFSTSSQALVICNMCQRKLALSTFATDDDGETSSGGKKPLYLEREHRGFCPVVNAETQGEPLLPGWKIRFNAALGIRLKEADDNLSREPTRRDSETDSVVSIEREMELRRAKRKEMLARVRKIVGGNS